MERILTLKDIAECCGGIQQNCEPGTLVSDVVTDSRKISNGSVFVALRGEKFDGHSFIADASGLGAVCCIADKSFENLQGLPLIVVEDTYAALRDIAKCYRNKFPIPVVAVTGSVGKTSTKDMVSCVLGNEFSVLKTQGNFNNEIGLPLTVFGLKKSHGIAVLEMGMSAFGEISRLTRIASPDTAILTNIGFSHIEHLGSQENIRKAKLEILEGMNSENGCVILNGDDELLWNVAASLGFETLTYGVENTECDITAKNITTLAEGTEFDICYNGKLYCAKINTPGSHHIYNALAAALAGIRYGMSMEDIVDGIGRFEPQGLRQNIETVKEYVIIKDCYNASPTSMKSGLEVLSVTKPQDADAPFRRIAVLGDMLELGDMADAAHESVGGMVKDFEADFLVAVGPHSECMAKGAAEKGFDRAKIRTFADNTEAKKELKNILKANDIILFKASRGMKLEELADFVAE